jgi:c-di-GMP-binding flagellar brake protein YcgR
MWIFIAVIGTIAAFSLTFFFLMRRAGGGKFPWVQFFLKGKESGFTMREVHLLRRSSVETRMKNPTSLFWSVKQLDRCIKGIIINSRSEGVEDSTQSVMMIDKLFEFRKRVEFSQPKYSLGLKATRDIATRQRIKVSLPNIGPFMSVVVENLRRYLAVSQPQGQKMPEGFKWKGQVIGVNFWREDDAGYFFQSKVLDDYSDTKGQSYPILHISHTESLMRTQKRNSIRVQTNIPLEIYPLRNVSEANEDRESGKGLKSVMKDLSEDGAAILIGGKAKVGLPLKIQFFLSGRELIMCGVVKGVNYDERKNRSLLHIQALPPSAQTKNILRSYVYNLFGEREPEKVASKAKG